MKKTSIVKEKLMTVKEYSPNLSASETSIKCTRCRNKHLVEERVMKRDDPKYLIFKSVCPRCECKSYTKII